MKVTYIDHMGTDLTVVNAARVSFGKKSEWYWKYPESEEGRERKRLSYADQNLIAFLARGCTSGEWEELIDDACAGAMTPSEEEHIIDLLNHIRRMPKHWVPFANGGTILLHFKAPIFVARQLFKHQAGFEPPSEISRRYVTDEPEFYEPEVWRKAANNVKQGSLDEPVDAALVQFDHVVGCCAVIYEQLLEIGVCPEQARMVLPQSMYTEWQWKGNLYAWASLFNTRTDPHAQKETQEIAWQIGEIIEPLFPVSWKELTR